MACLTSHAALVCTLHSIHLPFHPFPRDLIELANSTQEVSSRLQPHHKWTNKRHRLLSQHPSHPHAPTFESATACYTYLESLAASSKLLKINKRTTVAHGYYSLICCHGLCALRLTYGRRLSGGGSWALSPPARQPLFLTLHQVFREAVSIPWPTAS